MLRLFLRYSNFETIKLIDGDIILREIGFDYEKLIWFLIIFDYFNVLLKIIIKKFRNDNIIKWFFDKSL